MKDKKTISLVTGQSHLLANFSSNDREGLFSEPSFSTSAICYETQEELFSSNTKEILNTIKDLGVQPSPVIKLFSNSETLNEVLFDARAQIKILISQVSMYIPDEWRERLYRQLDILHDIDDWEDEDSPVTVQSFKTFLEWFLLSMPERPPGFGLSSTGNFIAAWATDRDKLILEFLPNKSVKWIVTKYFYNEPERATGFAKSYRIHAVLAPYSPESWLSYRK